LGYDFPTVDKSRKPWDNLVVVKHLSSDDSVSVIIWAPTSSETSAFVTEYLLQSTLQSITKLNSETFNRIWSPGKKILKLYNKVRNKMKFFSLNQFPIYKDEIFLG